MTTRVASFVFVSAAIAAIQSYASTARAANPDEATRQTDRGASQQGDGARNDAWRARQSEALGAGYMPGAFAGSFRVLGGFEPTSAIFFGLSYRGVRGVGQDDGFHKWIDTDFITGVFEYHPVAGLGADPYVSVDFGFGFYSSSVDRAPEYVTRRRGPAGGLGLGLAYRAARFAVGPQVSFVGLPAAGNFSVLLDLRLDGRF